LKREDDKKAFRFILLFRSVRFFLSVALLFSFMFFVVVVVVPSSTATTARRNF
jgi:hypothetical protein